MFHYARSYWDVPIMLWRQFQVEYLEKYSVTGLIRKMVCRIVYFGDWGYHPDKPVFIGKNNPKTE
jgi:hypothetical protein